LQNPPAGFFPLNETTAMATLRCISLWQPWASLVACGAKTIETRKRPAFSTILGARIGIQAGGSKIPVREFIKGPAWWVKTMEDALGIESENWTRDLPFGAIVATAVVEASFPVERLKPDPFGDFSPGRHGWMLTDLRPLAEPIPWKGAQGIFFAEIPDL
jgi:hypothetical protein